jgi:Aerotolerance regulator N-terminal/von Willebrand factor type A domain
VTFASAWALTGLVLLVPLVALHLRERGQPSREVPSLLLWSELDSPSRVGARGRRLPRLPLQLLLQALVVVCLVLALAQPMLTAGTARAGTVVVIDDSLWMSVHGRLETARREALRLVRSTPRTSSVAIVTAGSGSPQIVYRGGSRGVRAALTAIRPTSAPADLGTAVSVAGSALRGRAAHIYVVHAREDALPHVEAGKGQLSARTVGSPLADQGIFDPSARCGIGVPRVCEVYATVDNRSATPVRDSYSAGTAGARELTGSVDLAPNSSAQIALLAAPGDRIAIGLTSPDQIPADDNAVVAVPGVGGVTDGTAVTLVGTRSRSLALAQALVATPGVTLQLATPSTYRPALARSSGVLILDGWVPRGGLPPAPATVLIDPPSLPGGHSRISSSGPVVTGTDQSSSLLAGVDLSSLAVSADGGRAYSLPRWLTPVAWSSSGPILAAGDDGAGRLAVLSFEPSKSNLPQLSSFPVLVANIIAWASRWAPASAGIGEPMTMDAIPGARVATVSLGRDVVSRFRLHGRPVSFIPERPGFYTVSETGPGVSRSLSVAAAAENPAPVAGSVNLRAAGEAKERGAPAPLALWFLVAALIVMAGEGVGWALNRTRVFA